MSDPSPAAKGSEPRRRQRKQLQPGVCFKHTIRGFAGSRVTTRRFSPVEPSPQHPRPSGHDFICGATTSERFKRPLPLPPAPQSEQRCLRLGTAPGKAGAPTKGLPLREIKAGMGFVAREGRVKGFALIFTCFSLGCCFAAREMWNQRAALGLWRCSDGRQG